MKTKITLFATICSLFFSGCVTYFTQDVKDRIETGANRAADLQYYIDRRISLERITTNREDIVKGGKVKFVNGQYHYTVNMRRFTPGIAKNDSAMQGMRIFFEQGDSSYITFVREKQGNRYNLKPDTKKLWYQGKEFTLKEGGGTLLLIRKNSKTKLQRSGHRAKGLKVGK